MMTIYFVCWLRSIEMTNLEEFRKKLHHKVFEAENDGYSTAVFHLPKRYEMELIEEIERLINNKLALR